MNASLSMKKLEVLHFSSYSTSKKEGSVKVERRKAVPGHLERQRRPRGQFLQGGTGTETPLTVGQADDPTRTGDAQALPHEGRPGLA